MVGFRPLDLVVFLPFPMIIWLIFGDQSFLACSVIVTSKELRIEAKPQGVQIINLEEIISVKIVSTPLAVKRSGMTISFESTIAYKLNGWNMLQIHTKRQSNPNIFLIGVSDAPKLQKAIENALEARKNSIWFKQEFSVF